MKKADIIKSIVNQGYWDINTKSFRGLLFASKFTTDNSVYLSHELTEALKEATKTGLICEVITIYYQ